MASVPTGTQFFIAAAAAIAATKAITAITNATPAVVTSAAHGYSNGDIVLLNCGWGRLNRRAFRVANVTTNTYELEGVDTTNTTFYPAGGGAPGTSAKVTPFTQILQQMNPQSTGGEPKTVTYKYTDSDVENSINDGFTATSYTLELDADSISTTGYSVLKSLTEVQIDTIFLMVLRNGSKIYQPCTVALNEAVQMQEGQINRVRVAFNGTGRLTRFAS
jgi:hypothetical protein